MAGEPSAKASGQIGPELLEDYVSAVKTIRSVRGLIFFFLFADFLFESGDFAQNDFHRNLLAGLLLARFGQFLFRCFRFF